MRHLTKQINEQIHYAERILLVVHQNPDGDALGSASALQEYLLEKNKQVYIWSATPVLSQYHFLPHIQATTSDQKILLTNWADLILVLDSGDLERAGIKTIINNLEHKIINIDHHPTNLNYGFINLVQPTVSSTSEIIYYFFKHNNIRINHRMATALLTGIITDTDNFTNSATSINAFMAASDLIRTGGNLNLINQWIVRNKTLNSLRLWGAVLSRLKKIEEKNLIYTYITQEDIATYGVSENESEGIANFLNNLDSGGVCLILKEIKDNEIKGSFRTTHDDIDVSIWAKKLGGGGHKKAAGFSAVGTITEVLNKILTI